MFSARIALISPKLIKQDKSMEISTVLIYVLLGSVIGAGFLVLYTLAVQRSTVGFAVGLNICILVLHSLFYELGLIPSVVISVLSLFISIWIVRRRPINGESETPKKVGEFVILFSLLSGLFVASIELLITAIPIGIAVVVATPMIKRYWIRYVVIASVTAVVLIAAYTFLNDLR
jgi:hypothetical protein